MHELSIAMSIVEMAQEEAAGRGTRVLAVHLKLGPLAGVVKDALLSSYGLACEGTEMEGSRLVIEEVPVVAYCATCGGERTPPSMQWLVCPECSTPFSRIVRGRELEVFALEVDT
jgi:hydrogenase nickel incorporation protein HypA/HybF